MVTETRTRVEQNTPEEINERMQQQIEESVRRYSCGCPELIEQRLQELDKEWDIERTLQANAAGISLGSLFLGFTWKRIFLLMPAVVAGFLLQHALQGWCPPVEFFRRKGVRTRAEIDEERQALKALRGDFQGLEPRADRCNQTEDVGPYLEAARK